MSLNQSHHPATSGVILFQGERLLIFYDGCEVKLGPPLKTSCRGRVFLTSHRVIFINKQSTGGLRSVSIPFVNMRDVTIDQPIFGPNRVSGKMKAEVNGGWNGECTFSIVFNKGGAIEFGKTLRELGNRACSVNPPYIPSASINSGPTQYYDCPPPAYAPPYSDPYYNFVPQHEAFGIPPANSMYYTEAPPPYPGVVAPGTVWNSGPSQMSQNQSGYPQYERNHAQQQGNISNANHNGPGAGGVDNAFYFSEDQHSVFARASAPPPSYYSATSFDAPSAQASSTCPPYPTDPRLKKTQ